MYTYTCRHIPTSHYSHTQAHAHTYTHMQTYTHLIASKRTSGWRCGSALSNASFTITARCIMYPLKSKEDAAHAEIKK